MTEPKACAQQQTAIQRWLEAKNCKRLTHEQKISNQPLMIRAIKNFLSRGKLRKATFHVLTWNLQGKQPDWDLLDEEATDCRTGYPPDLICFQNLPLSTGDPEASRFIGSFPDSLRIYYFLQGPVVKNGSSFATLVRKECISFTDLYLKPPPAAPIVVKGVLIGIKSFLKFHQFPRTTISICNCNVTEERSLERILRLNNECIFLLAGMMSCVVDGKLLPAVGVWDYKDFRLSASTGPACCAPGTPSASKILYYSAASANNDSNCLPMGTPWQEPMDYGGESCLTNEGMKVFGSSIFQVSPVGWDPKP